MKKKPEYQAAPSAETQALSLQELLSKFLPGQALRSKPTAAGHVQIGRGVAPAAPHRQANRSRGRSVSRILRRLGLSQIRDLESAEPVRRHEREHQGELIHIDINHIDINKLGRFVRPGHRITGDRLKGESRGAGDEFVHVAIDDASRPAFSPIRCDEKKESAIAFLIEVVTYFRDLGMKVAGIMTDNGSCYRAKAFVKACKRLR